MEQRYIDTARMLVQVAPIVLAGDRFALKGGTAINLFEREMPRLPVDLDLVLQDGALDRTAALASINAGLQIATATLEKQGFGVIHRVALSITSDTPARRVAERWRVPELVLIVEREC